MCVVNAGDRQKQIDVEREKETGGENKVFAKRLTKVFQTWCRGPLMPHSPQTNDELEHSARVGAQLVKKKERTRLALATFRKRRSANNIMFSITVEK